MVSGHVANDFTFETGAFLHQVGLLGLTHCVDTEFHGVDLHCIRVSVAGGGGGSVAPGALFPFLD